MVPKRPEAVCILVLNDNKVLGVSRKDNPNDFGLPGGKVEEDDYINPNPLEHAAKRELLEETGLIITSLKNVYSAPLGKYIATCFLAEVEGSIFTHESGVVKWCDKEEIISGCFGEYHKKMFEEVLGKD
jgi:8-oxo-dGTP pyrophosphatase MutT (NUDIX family)